MRYGPDNVSFNMNCGDETFGGDIINVNRGLKNIVVHLKSDIFKENLFLIYDAVSDVVESGVHWRSNFKLVLVC